MMRTAPVAGAGDWAASSPPLQRFLNACHTDFAADNSGEVAHYIPELGKAQPEHFGIGLATLDGHVSETGDSRVPFTIQSMSKPFVFALALDTLGATRVEAVIGVEPSGDPFNSIRLNADNHPFNPMVNAGAIACSGLILEAKGEAAFDTIRQALDRFAGLELDVDEAVFTSESSTGDRNRAIGYLPRNSGGIKVCEALSSHYGLHMLSRSDDARNSIIADCNIGKSSSRRSRRPHERRILVDHHQDVRVVELVGTLSFSNVDYVSRQLASRPRPQFVIFDLRRVAAVTPAGARLFAEEFRELANFNVTVVLSGIDRASLQWKTGFANGRPGSPICATIPCSTTADIGLPDRPIRHSRTRGRAYTCGRTGR